jgi:hypothetical protein
LAEVIHRRSDLVEFQGNNFQNEALKHANAKKTHPIRKSALLQPSQMLLHSLIRLGRKSEIRKKI